MHNPPPFVPADIRISPSGPYVNPPGGGGIIRFGADAAVQGAVGERGASIDLTDTGATLLPMPRQQVPALVPLAVTFPAWRSGDVLWVNWHVSGLWLPTAPASSGSFRIFPVVTVTPGVPQLINNAGVISFPRFTYNGEVALSEGFAIAGTAAIRLVNPAQPPIVQLFYALAAADVAGAPVTSEVVSIAGLLPSNRPGSCWLTACELTQESVFQLPPEVTLANIT